MSERSDTSTNALLAILEQVKDPEVPVLSVVELGIVRDVVHQNGVVTVTITPTYSGCPAMHVIEQQIRDTLRAEGYEAVDVRTVFSPPWTTDWISEDARDKLREYGIAPPGVTGPSEALVPFPSRTPVIPCPFCRSRNTERRSEFGSTACKALYFCHGCRQPFEYFKAF